ncbi:MAG: tetratricopeptide repeat protein [Planctomycetes bacterium]|nr:tetratricopeptide repeat protein [Planctomycetota bacterium]
MTDGADERSPGVRAVLLAAVLAAVAMSVRLQTLHGMNDANPLFRVTVLDEAVYLREAARFRSGGGWTSSLVSLFWPWILSVLGAVDRNSAALVNVVIGSMTTVLATVGAAKLTRSLVAGAVAGLICALSGAMVFQDVTVQIEPVIAFSVLASALALAAAARRPTAVRLAIAGAAVGVATLARGTNVALVLGALPALGAGVPAGPCAGGASRVVASRWIRAAILFVGVAAPVALFDRAVGALPTSGGVNVWLGNNEWSRDTLSFGTDEFPMDPDAEAAAVARIAAASEGRDLTPPEINSWWVRRAAREIASHPGASIVHFATKLILVVYPDDMGGNHDAVLESEFAAPLRVLPVTFAWVLVVGAAGFVLTRKVVPGATAMGLAAAGVVGALVIVFPLTRYVAPLVPTAAVLAGAGASVLLRADRDRRTAAAAGVTVAALVTASFAGSLMRPSNRAEALMNLGVAAMNTGVGDSDRFFRRSAEADATYAPPLVMLGARAFDSGKFDEALARFDSAVAIAWENPKFVAAARDALLGRCRSLASLGRFAEALETADRAAAVFKQDAEFPAEGALIALAMRDTGGARRRVAMARQLDPANERVIQAESALGERR